MSARMVTMRRSGSAVLLSIEDDHGVLRLLRIAAADAGEVRELCADDRARVHGALATIHAEGRDGALLDCRGDPANLQEPEHSDGGDDGQ